MGAWRESNKQDLIMVDFVCSVETCYGIREETLTESYKKLSTQGHGRWLVEERVSRVPAPSSPWWHMWW